jgi:pimeloyl-ACP methyl ester carboxylesterase
LNSKTLTKSHARNFRPTQKNSDNDEKNSDAIFVTALKNNPRNVKAESGCNGQGLVLPIGSVKTKSFNLLRMEQKIINSFDGVPLTVLHNDLQRDKPYVTIVLPFGMRPKAASALYSCLSDDFNVLTWQSRSIVDSDDSAFDEASLTPHIHAEDMRHVMRHFQVGSSDVVGFCSGAGISMLAAVQYGALISRLALICGEYMLPVDVCRRTNFQREVDVLLPLAASSRKLAAILCEKLADGMRESNSEFQEEVMLPFSNPEYLYRHGVNYISYRQADFCDLAKRVTQRTLLISTESDRQVTSHSSSFVASLLRNVDGHIILPGDHYELLRNQSEVVRALLDFLNEAVH